MLYLIKCLPSPALFQLEISEREIAISPDSTSPSMKIAYLPHQI